MSKSNEQLLNFATVLLLVFSAGAWLYSVRDSGGAGATVESATKSVLAAAPTSLTVRTPASPSAVEARFDESGKTVVFMFSTTCAVCERQRKVWEDLAQASVQEIRFIALSGESGVRDPYFSSTRIREYYANDREALFRSFPSSFTPTTVVLRDGKVSAVRIGMVGKDELTQLVNGK